MKSYSPKLIIKLWQKSQSLAVTNPKISRQITALLKEVRVNDGRTIKRSELEVLLRGIIKEVVAGMQAIDDGTNTTKLFKDIPNKTHFQVDGYDDLFKKLGDTRAINCGSGWLSNARKLGEEGQIVNMKPDTKVSIDDLNEESGAGGMSTTANVSPITRPNAFKNKRIENIQPLAGMEEISAMPKPKIEVYPENFKEVSNYIRIKNSKSSDEFIVAWFINGKFNDDKSYYTTDLSDAYDTLNAMKPEVDAANVDVSLNEMTTNSAVTGYNVPGCFAKAGGSKKGVEGSEKLGYTLTSTGKDEMSRHADKLLEGMKKIVSRRR